MNIKVIGNSSSNRMKLMKNISKVISSLKGKYDLEILEDEKYLNKYGIKNTPGLVINDKLISQGKILNEKEIMNYIKVLN